MTYIENGIRHHTSYWKTKPEISTPRHSEDDRWHKFILLTGSVKLFFLLIFLFENNFLEAFHPISIIIIICFPSNFIDFFSLGDRVFSWTLMIHSKTWKKLMLYGWSSRCIISFAHTISDNDHSYSRDSYCYYGTGFR